MTYCRRLPLLLTIAMLPTVVGVDAGAQAAQNTSGTAAAALRAAGRDRGLCLVIGEADGELTAALAKGSRMYVQGCTRNARAVAAARGALVKAGVVARSSIVLREDRGLPYADNLLNLVVSFNLGSTGLKVEEVLRVLAPCGVAVLGGAGNAEAALKKAGVQDVRSSGGLLVFTKPVDPDRLLETVAEGLGEK